MGLIAWLKSRFRKDRPETETEEDDEDAYSIEPGTRYTVKLSEFLKVFDLNEVSVIYSRNEDGTYTFVIGYAFKIPSSYDNPTEQDLKDTEYGAAFRFVCNPEVMDVNEIYGMDNLDGYVRDNFRRLDIGQFIWGNGYYKTMLAGLLCSEHGEFIEFNVDGEIYYVRDFDLDAVCIPSKEFKAVYRKVFETFDMCFPRLSIGKGKIRIKLSDLLTMYNYKDDLQVVYRKNPDGTFTFYAAYIWNIPKSYVNPTEDDLKYCSEGMIVKTTGNIDIMDVEDILGMANLTDYVRTNFKCLDLGQFVNKNGLYQVPLMALNCEVRDGFIKMTSDTAHAVYVKDGVIDIEVVSKGEYSIVYDAAFVE
ncbi:MAG: hypothetical protein LUE27_09825 [Clostridia bacterium]|nr:hypothetical protein [Clostridia bacterium]